MTYEARVTALRKRFSGAAAQPPQERFAVQITLTGDEAGTLYIANTDRGFAVEPYDYRDHSAAMTVSGSDLTKLLAGTLRLDRAMARGLAQVEGDASHIELLHRLADPPARRTKLA